MAFLITDAPPHGAGHQNDKFPQSNPARLDWKNQFEILQQKGVQIHTLYSTDSNNFLDDFTVQICEAIAKQSFGVCQKLLKDNNDHFLKLVLQRIRSRMFETQAMREIERGRK